MEDPYLPEIVSAEWAALLVVDVQNDFCHQDGLFGKLGADTHAIQAAARRICELLPLARKVGVPVIFVVMEHDPLTNSTAWNQRYPSPRKDACVAGTWGAELYEVRPASGEPVVVKHRYSPFVGSNIQHRLRARQRKSLLVTGVATNICVESVLRDGFMHDYHVVLVEDWCRRHDEARLPPLHAAGPGSQLRPARMGTERAGGHCALHGTQPRHARAVQAHGERTLRTRA